MSPFQAIGRFLRSRYLSAIKVTVDQAGDKKALTKINKNKKPSGEALVYLEESPDYCLPNPSTGSLGTAGRECNRTSRGLGSCAILCCGRGFDTIEKDDHSKCECKFHWCCSVKCKKCRYKIDKHFCKAHNTAQEHYSSISSTRLRSLKRRPLKNRVGKTRRL